MMLAVAGTLGLVSWLLLQVWFGLVYGSGDQALSMVLTYVLIYF